MSNLLQIEYEKLILTGKRLKTAYLNNIAKRIKINQQLWSIEHQIFVGDSIAIKFVNDAGVEQELEGIFEGVGLNECEEERLFIRVYGINDQLEDEKGSNALLYFDQLWNVQIKKL